MSRTSDPVDTALESLRVHGTSHRDSLFDELEKQMLDDKRRPAAEGRLLTKVLIAAAILAGGGVVGYAAVNGRWWEGVTYFIEDDGVVTTDEGEIVGETVENDDGTYSTFIQLSENGGIVTTTDEPLTGTSIGVGTPAGTNGRVLIIDEAAAQKLAPEAQQASDDEAGHN